MGKKRAVKKEASVVSKIINFDIIDEFGPLIGTKMVIPPETGKMTEIEAVRTIRYDVPWIYTNPPKDADCNLYQEQVARLNYIPPRCLSCWKVVMRPRSFKEALITLSMQEKMVKEDPECYCKVGMEERAWVFGNWGAYWYTRNKKEGRKRWKQVRKMTDEYLGKGVKVILKRGCTEFERRFGPSNEYDRKFKDNPQYKEWERLIALNVDRTGSYGTPYDQPDMVRKHVLAKWVGFAWDRGDPTVVELNDGQDLLPGLVTYHDDLEEDEKVAEMKQKLVN